MAGTESHLLGLSEVIINIAVQLQFSKVSDRCKLLGPDLGRI